MPAPSRRTGWSRSCVAAALRAISPVVDITNYVMLELGQPMHGFDLAKLDGGIRVRMAEEGEKLDPARRQRGDPARRHPGDCRSQPGAGDGRHHGRRVLRCDAGRRETCCSRRRSSRPWPIAGKARSYGLHTDSSHRFERGVDSNLQHQAMRACHRTDAGDRRWPGRTRHRGEVGWRTCRCATPIMLRRERVRRLLGVEIDDRRSSPTSWSDLGMQLSATDEGWLVTAPSARFDIAHRGRSDRGDRTHLRLRQYPGQPELGAGERDRCGPRPSSTWQRPSSCWFIAGTTRRSPTASSRRSSPRC